MVALLAGSAFLFWLFTIGVIVLAILAVEYENGWGASGLLLLTAVAAWAIYDFNVIMWTLANLQTVLVYIGLYFLAAVAWGWTKWQLFFRAVYRAAAEQRVDVNTTKSFRYKGDYQNLPVKISDNKSRYLIWMTYWPVSAFWTLINDPVRRAFNAIYNAMAGSLQASSNKAFEKIRK